MNSCALYLLFIVNILHIYICLFGSQFSLSKHQFFCTQKRFLYIISESQALITVSLFEFIKQNSISHQYKESMIQNSIDDSVYKY